MEKISFKNDYSEGAHPQILEALIEQNTSQEPGYGYDRYSRAATRYIQEKIGIEAEVFFVAGGTQSNMLAIGHLLKPYQSVISTDISHIEEHETGAIEATGHKINKVAHDEGKLNVAKIQEVLDFHVDEHMVQPKMVYISLATEVGTIYSKSELSDISTFCKKNDLLLYIDGARMAMALTSKDCDWDLQTLAKWADVMYIGGTKNGTLLGEAIVFNKPSLADGFLHYRKQKGALLAKGRVLGIQFAELFRDQLYMELGQHANNCATQIAEKFILSGVQFKYPPQTNQIFPILKNETIEKLQQKFEFHIWEMHDADHSVIRLVFSWATSDEQLKILEAAI